MRGWWEEGDRKTKERNPRNRERVKQTACETGKCHVPSAGVRDRRDGRQWARGPMRNMCQLWFGRHMWL